MSFYQNAIIKTGWITKAVLLPLMKACFSGNQEIKSLLSSEALQSVVSNLVTYFLTVSTVSPLSFPRI